MWFIINIIQSILIIAHTLLCAFLALVPALLGFPKASYWIGRKIWGPLLLLMVGGKVEVKGKENLDTSRTFIYTANHISNFDIPILFTITSVSLHFIAKKELKKIPLFGWCIAAMGMIFVDRKNRIKAIESMKAAGELIKSGKNVIAFPEGKRSRSGKIERFRKGTFVIANGSQIDIIPIAIKGSEILHKPGGFKFRPGKVYINIGEPIKASSFADKEPEEFANYTQSVVEKLYKDI
jgi:1-acyl-sn-glycerol-3-phosphate acyltransferase